MGDGERAKTAEELERGDNSSPDTSAADAGEQVTDTLEREATPLQRGAALDTPLGPLPIRSLAAMGVFIAVAVAVYLVLWALLGTVGLLLGWIPAAALGLLAARELGRRAEREP